MQASAGGSVNCSRRVVRKLEGWEDTMKNGMTSWVR